LFARFKIIKILEGDYGKNVFVGGAASCYGTSLANRVSDGYFLSDLADADTHFAGLDKGGGNFRFTIFGVMNFQTDSDPSSVKISATLSVNGGGGWIHDWSGSQKREYTIL